LHADEFREEEELVGLMILQTYEIHRRGGACGFDDLQLTNIGQNFVAELGENLLQKNV
jgi:hypothetical protein